MNEVALRFGQSAALVGVLTEPEVAAAGAPAALLLNAGALHHIGPNRLHVDLARDLAAMGVPALRFDFSGIGDSGRRADQTPFLQSSVAETREAMDLLADRLGVRRFLLIGLCSGGNVAFSTAVEDRRVVGVGLINVRGHLHGDDEEAEAYYRNRGMRRHYLRLATRSTFRWKSWRKVLAGDVDYRGFLRSLRGFHAGERAFGKGGLAPELGELERRGVRLLHVFCEGEEGLDYAYVVLDGELERLGAPPHSRLELIAGANHTFTLLWSQRRLRELVRELAADCRAVETATAGGEPHGSIAAAR